MSRSAKKGPYIDEKLIKKINNAKSQGSKSVLKVWNRAATISPEMVGVTLDVYNGKVFNKVFITESMVGHKLGEFSLTRTFRGHSRKGKISKTTGNVGRVSSD